MKSILLIFTFIIFISTDEQKNTDLELICSGKWYIEYMEMYEQQIPLPGDNEENWMIFHDDGKHEIMSLGEIHYGKWEYLKDTRSIRMFEKEKYIDQKIEEITKETILLSFTIESEFGKMRLKK